jgi:hypothetical protein
VRELKTWVCGVPLEVLQEKRGVGPKLHLFLGVELWEPEVFGWAKLERSRETWSRAVPDTL